jgi:type I phosphodiesterase/nucleotide pyrophosphatase
MDLLLIQIDGLSLRRFRRALERRRMPRLAERLRSGWLHLHPTRVDLPSGTAAFQLGLLYGRSDLAPGTRWWDRRGGAIVDATRPRSLRRLETGLASLDSGLLLGGSAYGSSVSGGATSTDLSLAALGGPRSAFGRILRQAGGAAWSRAAAGSLRQALGEAFRWLSSLGRQRLEEARLSPLRHALAAVAARQLLVELACRDLAEGVPSVLINFFGHDQLGHHFGPDAPELVAYLEQADADIERLLSTAERSGRPRCAVLFSDHGQAPARPFASTYGLGLQKLVAELVRTTSRAEPPDARPLVLASGNLAQIYLSSRRPLVQEDIEAHFPGLTGVLRRHPAIGLVAARAETGSLFVGTPTHQAVLGPDQQPPAKLGLGETASELLPRLRALLAIEDAGDLLLFGAEVDGRLVSFLHQWGCHNGYLGDQLDAFAAVSPNAELQIPQSGVASSLHHQLLALRADRSPEDALATGKTTP